MAHKLFETKPGVKFLITTEICNNLQLLFTTTITDPQVPIVIKFTNSDAAERLRDYLDNNGFAYADYNSEHRFRFIKHLDGDRTVQFPYGLSFKSILDHLNFNHPFLYWYLIS